MANSSRINNPNDFHASHYIRERDLQSLLHRPNSGFSYQHAPFNLNSSEKLDSRRRAAIDDNSSGGRPQVFKPIPKSMDGNIGQPSPGLNFGMPMFSRNQGAVSLNSPEMLEERHLTSHSGSNTNPEINTKLFGINLAGESKREFVPPISAHHSKMDSRRYQYPDFGMSGAISGSQNNDEVMHNLPLNSDASVHSIDNHNLRPGLRLGPSYDFRGPSLPLDINQMMRCNIKQSKASEHAVFSSPGMLSNQLLSGQLPEFKVNSNGTFSLQSSTYPLGMGAGRTSGMDPSNLGMHTGMRNMIGQASRPSVRSSLKRGASEPQSSLSQARQRKTLVNHPYIHPSIPNWSGSAPLMPNTSQTIFRSAHKGIPLPPQAIGSTVHPSISPWARTALSAPNISQTIPPLVRATPSLPPQACGTVLPPHHNRRIPSIHPGSQIKSHPYQPKMTRSLPSPHWRPPPIMPSTPKAVPLPPSYIKLKDANEAPELIGFNCCLCKRDLSFAPEGPISQPSPPPDSAVLPCGHTFHRECLERMTPEDQSNDPSCIPCAIGE